MQEHARGDVTPHDEARYRASRASRMPNSRRLTHRVVGDGAKRFGRRGARKTVPETDPAGRPRLRADSYPRLVCGQKRMCSEIGQLTNGFRLRVGKSSQFGNEKIRLRQSIASKQHFLAVSDGTRNLSESGSLSSSFREDSANVEWTIQPMHGGHLHNPSFKVAALFAGIGGIELGMQRALGHDIETMMFCEWWEPAQHVLSARFPGVEVHPDIRELKRLPDEVNFVTAGFPCTDLSQAGRTVGISGENSGLVRHLFDALRVAEASRRLPTLMIENVPNMLALDRGKAMAYLVSELEALGYRWAYRVVDSRFTGVPQRRRRVILIASVDVDPRDVLFSDDAGPRPVEDLSENAFGFYWTEGRSGLGWAQDAVPTIKGGSTIGIPSPPAVWVPSSSAGRKFVKPSIEDAEAMQGFDRGWTAVEGISQRKNGPRWKLIGNAVTVGVAQWVASRLAEPGQVTAEYEEWEIRSGGWPSAAWGENGRVWTVPTLSEFPVTQSYQHLSDVMDSSSADVLSHRATAGFMNRLQRGNLGRHPGFRHDIEEHVNAMATP